MANRIKNILLLTALVAVSNADAYEVETHATITEQAYGKSVLVKNNTLSLMNIEPSDLEPFGDAFYDVSGTTIIERNSNAYEKARMPDGGPLNLTVQGWLMRGAIREDDLPCILSPTPCDGDPENIVRVFNHFYDPVNDKPLNAGGIPFSGAEKAVDWASGSADAYTQPNTPDPNRQNHYSFADAREAMHRALTGLNTTGTNTIGPGGSTMIDEAVRNAYWATTFRSLGDVIHLVQDMSQPQHTRNEQHKVNIDGKGHTFFESYTNSRTLQKEFTCENGQAPFFPPPLRYGGYKVPAFNKFTDYFSTRDTDTSVNNRRGMADFSNREFFTPGSNLGDSSNPYNYPVNDVNDPSYQWKELEVSVPCMPAGFSGKLTLAMKDVRDVNDANYVETYYSDPYSYQTLTSRQVPVSTLGMWSRIDDEGFFSTNEAGTAITAYNYTAMADVTIPRAVSYSAGMIDYFFRGRLEISKPDEGIYGIIDHSTEHTVINSIPTETGTGEVFGFRKILLKVRNISEDIDDGQAVYPQDVGAGTLRAIASYRYSPCYTRDLSGEESCNTADIVAQEIILSVSDPITISTLDSVTPAQFEFNFSTEPIPINASDLRIQVVFLGDLGSETGSAIAVGMKDISEPTYITARNSTDYYSYYGTRYRIDETSSQEYIDFQQDWDGREDNNGDDIYNDPPSTPYQPLTADAGNFRIAAVTDAVTTASLDFGHFVRVAILADNGIVNLNLAFPSFDSTSPNIATRTVQLDDPQTGAYTLDPLVSMGEGSNLLYTSYLLRLFRDAYPAGYAHGADIFNDFPVIPDPDPVTICFPEGVCLP